MINTVENVRVYKALCALARAHMRLPGFDIGKAKDLTVRIDALCRGERTMEVVAALVIALIGGLGVPEPGDESRFRMS